MPLASWTPKNRTSSAGETGWWWTTGEKAGHAAALKKFVGCHREKFRGLKTKWCGVQNLSSETLETFQAAQYWLSRLGACSMGSQMSQFSWPTLTLWALALRPEIEAELLQELELFIGPRIKVRPSLL